MAIAAVVSGPQPVRHHRLCHPIGDESHLMKANSFVGMVFAIIRRMPYRSDDDVRYWRLTWPVVPDGEIAKP
jgi:hypothetical protein